MSCHRPLSVIESDILLLGWPSLDQLASIIARNGSFFLGPPILIRLCAMTPSPTSAFHSCLIFVQGSSQSVAPLEQTDSAFTSGSPFLPLFEHQQIAVGWPLVVNFVADDNLALGFLGLSPFF